MKEIRSGFGKKIQYDGEMAPLGSGDVDENGVHGQVQYFEYGEIRKGFEENSNEMPLVKR